MSMPYVIRTICEVVVAAFIIWGLFHEQTLIDFEDQIIAKLKERKSK